MLLFKFLRIYYKSILYIIFVFIISIYPFQSDQERGFFNFPHFDKVIHFFLYGILAFLIFIEKPGKLNLKDYSVIVLICLILGGVIELIQITQPRRTGDFYDLLANFSGSLFAIPFYALYQKLKE